MSKQVTVAEPIPGVLAKTRRAEKKVPHHKRLTMKQRVAIKHLLDGQSFEQAAKTAGYSRGSTLRNYLRPNNSTQGQTFRKHFLKRMDAAGLSDGALLRPVHDALKADMVKWNSKDEGWDSFKDHTTRLKAAEMGLQLKGRFPTNEEKGPLVSVVVMTNLQDVQEVDDAFTIEAKLDQEPAVL
jgi:hypothetical protein